MVFGLEAYDRNDFRVGIPLAQIGSHDAVAGEVGEVGRVSVAFPTATHRLDVALLPFLDLSVVGRILLPAVLEVVDDSLQFHIVVFNRLA